MTEIILIVMSIGSLAVAVFFIFIALVIVSRLGDIRDEVAQMNAKLAATVREEMTKSRVFDETSARGISDLGLQQIQIAEAVAHTNQLLKWIGEDRLAPQSEPARE